MSVAHFVFPFDRRALEAPSFESWYGQALPTGLPFGQMPTRHELLSTAKAFVLSTSDKYRLMDESFSGRLKFTIMDGEKSYLLHIEEGWWLTKEDNDRIEHLSIRGDRGVLELLLKMLPVTCGTFIVSTDGEEPALITASGY